MSAIIGWFKHWFGPRHCPLCHGTGQCLASTVAGTYEYLRCYICAGKGTL